MTNLSPANAALLQSLLPAELLAAFHQPTPSPMVVEECCTQLAAVLQTLLPFVPSLVAETYLSEAKPNSRANHNLVGTVLLVELTDCVALVSQLATAGRQAHEDVRSLINRLFAVLIDEMYTYGGGLVKFDGVTLTGFFNAHQLGSHHAALACAAAQAIQARFVAGPPIPTPLGDARTRFRIAVHSGTVFAAEVGDTSHIELIITGHTVKRAAAALEIAGAGEILISIETFRLLSDAVVEHKRPDLDLFMLRTTMQPPPQPAPHSSWVVGPPSSTTVGTLVQRIRFLQPYVPADLTPRLARLDIERGDFRPVTALFANFAHFSRFLTALELPALMEQDSAIIGRVLNTYYTRTQTIVQRYGGTINAINMATFGDRLLAFFGAPTAHEDDPFRAVQTALALQAAINDIGHEVAVLVREWADAHPAQRSLLRIIHGSLRQRIGVASGTVFAGIVGTSVRREYTVIGDTVERAARLMVVANDGAVYVSAATQHAIQPWLKTEAISTVIHPHAHHAVPAFRVIPEGQASAATAQVLRRTAPLIGRTGELEQLLVWAQDALDQDAASGDAAVLVGEAGIGKTRLVDELLRKVRGLVPTAVVAQSVCYSYELTTPYAVVTRLLRVILRQAPSSHNLDDQAQALMEHIQDVAPGWSRFAPLLGPILGLPLPETELTQALTSEQRHERLHALIHVLCSAAAQRQPLVVVVDNLQWADASSLTVLQSLARQVRGQPILLVMVTQPTPTFTAWWRSSERVRCLKLQELSTEESAALVRSLLSGSPPDEIQPLITRATGTPLFLEETVRYLLETQVLTRDSAGRWVGSLDPRRAAIPTGVEQLIFARFDRLPEASRLLLSSAAVLGERFDVQLITTIHADQQQVPQQLSDLVDQALLVPDERGDVPAYRFKSTMIRDVIYSSLLFARRRELHAQAAMAIEAVYAAELDTYRAVLAHHLIQSAQMTEALPHLIRAAELAQARFANEEALALYQQGCEIAAEHDHVVIRLCTRMGDILALTGRYDASRDHYMHALTLLRKDGMDHGIQQAALQRKIGGTYESQGDLTQAHISLEVAQTLLTSAIPGPESTLEHARILSDIGWIYFRQNNISLAQEHLDQALVCITPLAVPNEETRILNRLAGVAWSCGMLSEAQRYVAQSLEQAQQSGNLVDQAHALNNLGLITDQQGLLQESLAYSQQAIMLNERMGNRRMLAFATNNAVFLLITLAANPGKTVS